MKRIIMASITAVVVIAVLAGTLIPILDDATATHDTKKSIGYYYMSGVADDESFTYAYDGTNWTLNGDTMSFPTGGFNVLVTDEHFIRSNGVVDLVSVKSLSVTATSSGISGSYVKNDDSTVTVEWDITGFYGATLTEDDYIMTNPSNTSYVNADTDVIGFGVTNVSGQYPIFHIVGDMESVTVTCTDTNVSISNIKINKTAVNGYIDLYDFESITFDATKGGTTTAVTYNRVILPAEVTAERTVHFDSGENAIFNAIPVMVIIALLLGVVALVLRSRMD